VLQSLQLSNQVQLPYIEQGLASGVPVLLVHGFAGSLDSFQPVLEQLPTSLHAFALTLRGHGEASKPETGYTIDILAADVLAFMDALGLTSAAIVGHSMGSAIALRLALDHPRRVRSLVLVGATPLEPGGADAQAFWESTVSKLGDPIDPALIRDFLESLHARPIPQERFELTLRNCLDVPARVWKATWKGRIDGTGLSGDLGEIKAPTLIVWGNQDQRAPRHKQEALVAGIPDARLRVYAGVGHEPHVEVPEQLASDIAAFVVEKSADRIE
jgi:non-heme chloroperoxidase